MKPKILPEMYKTLFPDAAWAELPSVWVGESKGITPGAFQIILERHNNRNRPISEGNVKYLAERIMGKGLWMLTGETIIFDWDNEVLSAQHRAKASVLSGVPIPAIIIVGVDPKAADWVDHGRAKTPADRLAAAGFKNCRALASLCHFVMDFITGGTTGRSGKYNVNQVQELIGKHPELVEESLAWSIGKPAGVHGFFGGPAFATMLHWMFSKSNKEWAELFLTTAASNRIPPDAEWNIVAKLSSQINNWKSFNTIHAGALTIKAWNAWTIRKSLGALVWRDNELFPKINGWTYDKKNRPIKAPDGTVFVHDDNEE